MRKVRDGRGSTGSAGPQAAGVDRFDFGTGEVEAAPHTNPDGTVGGWVAFTANVDGATYVAPGARVFGNARVFGATEVLDDASVFDNARVHECVISGSASIGGDSTITDAVVGDRARVVGNAHISNGARILGDARVGGKARVMGDALVHGEAVVNGKAWISGGEITGNVRVDGDTVVKPGVRLDGDQELYTGIFSGPPEPAVTRETSAPTSTAPLPDDDEFDDLDELIEMA
jgi:carbonic anhydrase/acetyltransferase-like protein (isoleucine patch superfamily)